MDYNALFKYIKSIATMIIVVALNRITTNVEVVKSYNFTTAKLFQSFVNL